MYQDIIYSIDVDIQAVPILDMNACVQLICVISSL